MISRGIGYDIVICHIRTLIASSFDCKIDRHSIMLLLNLVHDDAVSLYLAYDND